MSSNRPRVIVAVAEHWILGQLPPADTRIQDQLNDSRSDFVEISDVEVHSCTDRQCVAKLSQLVIPKSNVVFVAAHLQQHEAPDGRLNHFSAKNVFQGFATLSHYRISGELHLPTFAANTVQTLSHQLPRFFPLTEAAINGGGVSEFRVPLLIANKDFVNCFHVGEETHKKSDSGPLELLRSLVAESSTEKAFDGSALAGQ